MARVNFGRSLGTRGYNPMDNILKAGYIIKMRGQFYMVDSVEGMNYQSLVTANGNTAGTEVGNGFDSGFYEDEDLEPFRNHLYFLVPSLSRQPKFIARDGTYNGVGFPNDTTELTLTAALKTVGAASRERVGDISGRCFVQHPAGVPRWSADSSPGDDKTGWIDVNNSPQDDPNLVTIRTTTCLKDFTPSTQSRTTMVTAFQTHGTRTNQVGRLTTGSSTLQEDQDNPERVGTILRYTDNKPNNCQVPKEPTTS